MTPAKHDNLSGQRRSLLQWYDAHRRPLPWRAVADPYAIWISEVMLQQTTVKTVEPRWRQFLARFPTVSALANAPLADVLEEWTGLGYYARARHVHAAAQRIRDDFGGELPATFEALLSLPGMGRYIASAVGSIAFGQQVAVLDANVERVLARFDGIEEPITRPAVKRRLWDRAQELLDPHRPGDWNQMMMELGAVVCLPRSPLCGACPLAPDCRGKASGDPARLPIKAPKPAMEDVREAAIVLRRADGRLLVLLRPESGSFARMWEIPRVVAGPEEQSEAAALRAARELANITADSAGLLLRLNHTVMRRRIRLTVWQARSFTGRAKALGDHMECRWVTPQEWLALPRSGTQKQVAEMLAGGGAVPNDDRRLALGNEGDLFSSP